MSHTITRTYLDQLVARLLSAEKSVVGLTEANGRYFFRNIDAPQKMILDSAIMPSNSIKEFLFPRCETLCSYQYEEKQLVITDAEPSIQEQIIFPEIEIDKITTMMGMDITIVTTANTDQEGFALLKEFGFPFKK